MRLNGLGFEVDCDWESVLAPEVVELCDVTETPHWMMLGGPHGEFELVFTMPEERLPELEQELEPTGTSRSSTTGASQSRANGASRPRPIRIGRVRDGQGITLVLPENRRRDIDMAAVRNLLDTTDGDLTRYVTRLRGLGKEWGLEG